jgi:hypothetical protein
MRAKTVDVNYQTLMWPFSLSIRAKTYLNREDVVHGSKAYSLPGKDRVKSFVKYLTRFSEDDAERVILAYCRQDAPIKHDPVEEMEEYAIIFEAVKQILDNEFPEQRMGQCHKIWRRKKELLKKRGVSWLSLSELNPSARFD